MTSVERELVEKISNLSLEKQQQVLDFVRSIDQSEAKTSYSAREVMKLPFEVRNRLVIEALERSADEDVELFDAYSDVDFDMAIQILR